jgi:hypothetical protein
MINQLRTVYYVSIVFFIIIVLLSLGGCSPYRQHDLQVLNSKKQVIEQHKQSIIEHCKLFMCDGTVTGQ